MKQYQCCLTVLGTACPIPESLFAVAQVAAIRRLAFSTVLDSWGFRSASLAGGAHVRGQGTCRYVTVVLIAGTANRRPLPHTVPPVPHKILHRILTLQYPTHIHSRPAGLRSLYLTSLP